MAYIQHLFRAPKRRLPMEGLSEARLITDFGVEGCAHARPGSGRQVLLVDFETLEAMDLAPGILRENITSEGLAINTLKPGQRLRIGDALLEVSIVCTPCDQMEKLRPGLRRRFAAAAACCVVCSKAAWSAQETASKGSRSRAQAWSHAKFAARVAVWASGAS